MPKRTVRKKKSVKRSPGKAVRKPTRRKAHSSTGKGVLNYLVKETAHDVVRAGKKIANVFAGKKPAVPAAVKRRADMAKGDNADAKKIKKSSHKRRFNGALEQRVGELVAPRLRNNSTPRRKPKKGAPPKKGKSPIARRTRKKVR